MNIDMQPLTGPDIHQLSLHGTIVRNERCWCCGSKRHFKIVDCIGYESCKLSDERENGYIHKCPYYIILDHEKGEGVCVTPCTGMGNCNGRGISVISIIMANEAVDVLDLIDEYGIEEVTEFIKNDDVVKKFIEEQRKL